MSTAAEQQRPHDEYDSPWKDILEHYFTEFLEFFFPVAYAGIDWSKGHGFLDKELQKIMRNAEVGRRVVDKLVKVFTTDGDETWVVVHVEVQGQYEVDFAKRMYVYNYRLFDRYNRDIV
ncbi:MAG: cytosolic protein, partial [bacterium]|nr:cytosolic protein [bacterium]